ncbi:MAG TPA: peptide deformylase, partial [Methanocorpusculum sp.]|nr:peptide deformylase [Methanocorpusculum sp.]
IIMDIQIYGTDVLAKKAEAVPEITPELTQILDEMVPLMAASHGVGLAAPQVGISQRFFVMNAGDKVRKVINPEIVQYGSALAEMEEGCLSIPGIHKKVRRSRRISVRYTDETGAVIEEELKDFTARVFQHEYDHLDGIMFVDRLTPMSRKLVQRQLDALKEKKAT